MDSLPTLAGMLYSASVLFRRPSAVKARKGQGERAGSVPGARVQRRCSRRGIRWRRDRNHGEALPAYRETCAASPARLR